MKNKQHDRTPLIIHRHFCDRRSTNQLKTTGQIHKIHAEVLLAILAAPGDKFS